MRMRAALSVILAFQAGLAVAAECSAVKGHGSGWSWREIEGRRCWYHGRRGTPKGTLHWRHGEPAPRAPAPDWPLRHHAGPAPRAPVAPPLVVPAAVPAAPAPIVPVPAVPARVPALTEFELRYRGLPP